MTSPTHVPVFRLRVSGTGRILFGQPYETGSSPNCIALTRDNNFKPPTERNKSHVQPSSTQRSSESRRVRRTLRSPSTGRLRRSLTTELRRSNLRELKALDSFAVALARRPPSRRWRSHPCGRCLWQNHRRCVQAPLAPAFRPGSSIHRHNRSKGFSPL